MSNHRNSHFKAMHEAEAMEWQNTRNRGRDSAPLETLELIYHAESQRGYKEQGAILVSEFGDKEGGVWLPKSQCIFTLKDGPPGYTLVLVTAPVWLLEEKGLV